MGRNEAIDYNFRAQLCVLIGRFQLAAAPPSQLARLLDDVYA